MPLRRGTDIKTRNGHAARRHGTNGHLARAYRGEHYPDVFVLVGRWSVFPIGIYASRDQGEEALAEIVFDEPDWKDDLKLVELVPAESDDVLTNPIRWN